MRGGADTIVARLRKFFKENLKDVLYVPEGTDIRAEERGH
jgi:hypothetical protein